MKRRRGLSKDFSYISSALSRYAKPDSKIYGVNVNIEVDDYPYSVMDDIVGCNDNLMALRTSCDRCRNQKLRCVPSSKTNPTAPCQRCSRLKEPTACVFSRRLRTGRHKKGAETQQEMPLKSQTTFAQSLPGMSTFTLSTSASHESPVSADIPGSSGTPMSSMQSHQSAIFSCGQDEFPMSGQWDADDLLDMALAFAPPPTYVCPEELSIDIGAFLDDENWLQTSPDTTHPDSGGEFTMIETTEMPQGPLVDLSSMLPIMSRYFIGYIIPTERGNVDPGKRLINWVWYYVVPMGSIEMRTIFTDINGKHHRNTVPQGLVNPTVWAKQVERYLPQMTLPLAEIVSLTPQPFVTKVGEVEAIRSTFYDGRLVLVGDAFAGFRSHLGKASEQAARHCLEMDRVWTGEITQEQRDREAVLYAKRLLLLNQMIGLTGLGFIWAVCKAGLTYIWLILKYKVVSISL